MSFLSDVYVNPSSTSEGLSYHDPYRDYISANRILAQGMIELSQPAERRSLITAKAVIDVQIAKEE